MPNWCNNYTEIEGPVETIKELYNAGKDEKFLEHMAPLGQWDYHDALSEWGTKWEVDIVGLELINNGDTATIKGYFESAWSPPEQAFTTFMMNNEDVSARLFYYEPAMDFVRRFQPIPSTSAPTFAPFICKDLCKRARHGVRHSAPPA